MKRAWYYILIGIIVYLVALISTFPAQRAYTLTTPFLKNLPTKPVLSGVAGSVWSGRADTIGINYRDIGALEWDLSLWPFFTGRIGGDVSLYLTDGLLQADTLLAGSGDAALQTLEGRLSLTELQPFLPMLPITLGGVLEINVEKLVIPAGGVPKGRGVIVWRDAEMLAPQQHRLGDLTLTLSPGKNGGTLVEVSDNGGPLQVEGSVEVDAKQRYKIDLRLGSVDKGLSQFLSVLGKRDSKGRVAVKLEGRL